MDDEKLNDLIMQRKRDKYKNATTWKKGQTTHLNRSGRPKGAKNKWSKTIREEIQKAIGYNIVTLKSDLEKMKPLERVKVYALLGKFILAEKKQVDKRFGGHGSIEVSFSEEFNFSEKDLQKEKKRIQTIDIEFDSIENSIKEDEALKEDKEPKDD